MKPYRIIAFSCHSINGNYPCNILVAFPHHPANSNGIVDKMCSEVLNDSAEKHGGIKILSKHEKIIMVN